MHVGDLLKDLAQDLPQTITSNLGSQSNEKVSAVCFDSRKITPGCLFVAVRGGKSDGHHYLAAAVAGGAVGLIVENASKVPDRFKGAVAVVQNSRKALNVLASHFYGNPAKKLFCVGVTGTNGKTTTTYMVESIFERAGLHCGVIGTINHHYRDRVWATEMTTPDPVAFQARLAEFVDLGAKAVALEVSSHALSQSRVDEVSFDVAVFTNLSRDHLDYHKDMDDYFAAKNKLFKTLLSSSVKAHPTAVINAEDSYAKKIETTGNVRKWMFGPEEGLDLRFKILEQSFLGTRFELRTPKGSSEFTIPMIGLHNVSNACGAVGAALAADISIDVCAAALKDLKGVAGRLEAVPNKKGLHVFVDYAHTDDALTTVLHYLNDIRKKSKTSNQLITVFGCGGDRDKGKRPLMAKAAVKDSDIVVLTSDNPRTENPEQILDDAIAGVPQAKIGEKLYREVDRKRGIAKALDMAKPGDVVLIAGKGHEDYQIIGTTKHPFSDVAVVQELLK